MKSLKMSLLAVAICASAFAGQLIDSANIFGPRSGEVAGVLAPLPVSVETTVNTPAEGLKTYADSKAERNNFYVVITTQPRAWRISMNPIGLASSESVRVAGDRMTAKFKQGDFAGGIENLARELEKLTHSVATVHYAPAAIAVEQTMDEGVKWFLWIMGGVIAFIIICCLTVWFIERSKKKKEEKARQDSINAKTAAYLAGTKKPTKAEQAKAREMFDSYTPEQRERVSVQYINHPYYHSSILNDPFMFYWFMTTINQPHYGYAANPGYGYAAPAPSSPTQSDPVPSSGSSWFSSPSSSDSSGASSSSSSSDSSSYSPSYDSGSSSSSFDSGSSSSSDSSGGGGSW